MKLASSKIALVVSLALLATGCATGASEYYAAVQAAAQAQAAQSEARYRALATVAASGNQEAAVAATMAIALTQNEVIVPQYVPAQGTRMAELLLPVVGNVAGVAISAGITNKASDNNKDVLITSITGVAPVPTP